jgi:hypothetical protein
MESTIRNRSASMAYASRFATSSGVAAIFRIGWPAGKA